MTNRSAAYCLKGLMSSRRRMLLRCATVGLTLAGAVGVAAVPAGAVTDPEDWADTFCTNTTAYVDGAAQAAKEFNDWVLSDPNLTPQGLKDAFVEFISGGADATKALGSEVKSAGVPKIANGAKIQASILAGIAGTAARLAVMVKGAKALPTKNQKLFEKGFDKLIDQLHVFIDPFEKGVKVAENLQKDGQLDGVFESVPSCVRLANS